MDPICHSLTGAALGYTGLQMRSRFGRATLIIGANLPDIDAVTYLLDGADSLGIRRGLTHGIPALVVMPLLLAAAMRGVSAVSPGPAAQRADFRQLWLLSAIAMATHPFLDYLNNYGMRWLMPFVDRWVYGDTLYIIDPYVWSILLAGVLLAAITRRGTMPRRRRPAAISLAVTCVYIVLSAGGTLLARQATLDALQHDVPERLMASPVLLRPLERRLVVEYDSEYRVGRVSLSPLSVEIESERILKGDPRDLARAAASPEGQVFLHWARFPFSESASIDGKRVIRVMDARYVREWEEGFGALEIVTASE
ncbi:MAG TPA: metal-dependent hydrolase [Woeseiaceae bacterium]